MAFVVSIYPLAVSVTSHPAGVSTSLFASPMSIIFCNFTCNMLGLIHVIHSTIYIYIHIHINIYTLYDIYIYT